MLSTHRRRSFIFDLDGTLVDSLPGISYCVESALRDMGRNPAGDISQFIGPPIREILRRVLVDATESELINAEKVFRAHYDTAGWKRTILYPGVKDAVEELSNDGNRLFVFTNKPHHAARSILQLLGVSSLFEAVLSRDSKRPPYESKAAMLSDILGEYKLRTDETEVVGDSYEDFEAAKALGIPFRFVTYGYGTIPKESISSVPKISSLIELLSIPIRGSE